MVCVKIKQRHYTPYLIAERPVSSVGTSTAVIAVTAARASVVSLVIPSKLGGNTCKKPK
jgi:hypothetical protein